MGSSYSIKKCERCGGVESVEINCQTFEEYHICMRCGKALQHSLLRNKATGAPILDNDGLRQYVTSELPGYGCVKLARSSGYNAIYPLEKPYSDKDLAKYKAAFSDKHLIPEQSYLTRWDDASGRLVLVEGKMPEDYEVYAKNNGFAE